MDYIQDIHRPGRVNVVKMTFFQNVQKHLPKSPKVLQKLFSYLFSFSQYHMIYTAARNAGQTAQFRFYTANDNKFYIRVFAYVFIFQGTGFIYFLLKFIE